MVFRRDLAPISGLHRQLRSRGGFRLSRRKGTARLRSTPSAGGRGKGVKRSSLTSVPNEVDDLEAQRFVRRLRRRGAMKADWTDREVAELIHGGRVDADGRREKAPDRLPSALPSRVGSGPARVGGGAQERSRQAAPGPGGASTPRPGDRTDDEDGFPPPSRPRGTLRGHAAPGRSGARGALVYSRLDSMLP